MSDIKIFVSDRIDVDSVQIDNPIYVPVRCGAVFDSDNTSEIIGDDTGDNVSNRRLSFCEETVLYWAWKNVKADYYGFCHYRRFLSFANKKFETSKINNHIIEEYLDNNSIKKYHLNDTESIHNIVENTDIVTICPMNLRNFEGEDITVYKHLIKHTHWFKKRDINLIFEVIKEKYPSYLSYTYDYMNGYILRGFNCYILKSNIFNEYCKFCFDILFELEKRIDTTYYNQQMKRFTGFVSELLFAIFYNKQKEENKSLITKEVQLVRFNHTEKDKVIMPKKDVITIFTTVFDETAFSAAPLISTMIEQSSENKKYELIILCDKLSERNKELLEQLFDNKNNFNVKFFSPYIYIKNIFRDYSDYNITEKEALNIAAMFIPYMFNEHKKIIYMKNRAVLKTDIAELSEVLNKEHNGDSFIGIVEDIYSEALYTIQKNLFHNVSKDLEEEKKQFAEITVHGSKFKNHIDCIVDEFPEFNINNIASDFVLCMDLYKVRNCIQEEELVEIIIKLWEKQVKVTNFELINVLYAPYTYTLGYEWNIHGDVQLDVDNILKYSEYYKYEQYKKAISNGKAYNYSGNLEPWRKLSMPNNVEFINLIKQTPFYEDLLMTCFEQMAINYTN